MQFVGFALRLLVASMVLPIAAAQPSTADEAKTLIRLEGSLRILHRNLATASASSLGLAGRRAALFDEACAENASYLRTVVAAVHETREKADLVKLFHAAVALTGLQYDLNGLLLAARMSGSEKADEWSANVQVLVDDVNKLSDAAYSRIEGRVINESTAMRKPRL